MPSCFCLIYGQPILVLGGILPLAACHLFESQTVPSRCISLYHHCVKVLLVQLQQSIVNRLKYLFGVYHCIIIVSMACIVAATYY